MVVVNPGAYTLILGDTRTGRIHTRVPFESIKWGQRLNNSGPVSAVLRPHSKELSRLDLRSITTTVRNFIGVDYGGTILEAGPIWTRKYNPEARSLSLAGLGLWSIFDRRKNINWSAVNLGWAPQGYNVDATRGHLGSIARFLVEESIGTNPNGGLPIVLPANIPGTAHTRTYHGFNLGWLGDDLRELTEVTGGPDLRFRPRYKAGVDNEIEWVFEHGQVDLLQQTGPDWFWTTATSKSPVLDYAVDQDGSDLAARVWTPGSGQEVSMRLAWAEDLGLVQAGFPYTEFEKGNTSEENMGPLQSLADRTLEDHRRPWDTWKIIVRADQRPTLGQYQPGDWAIVRTPDDHPILDPDELIRVRILSIDGSSNQSVSIEVGPTKSRV